MQELDALVLRRRHAPVFREPVQRPAVRHLYGLRGAVVDNDELGAGWQPALERLDGGGEEVRSVQRGDADADARGLLGVVIPRWCRQIGLRSVADSVDHDLGHWRTSMNRQCAESEGLEPPRACAPAAFEAVSSTSRALSSGALAGSGSTQRERWQHLAGTGRARQKRRPESGEEDALKGRRCAARGGVPAPAERVFQDSSIACSSSLRWEIAPFLLATGESHTPWRASSLTSRRSGLLSRKAIAIRLRISSTPRLLRRAVRTRFTNSRRATGPSRRAFAKALAMNSCPRGEASAFRMTSSRSFLVAISNQSFSGVVGVLLSSPASWRARAMICGIWAILLSPGQTLP